MKDKCGNYIKVGDYVKFKIKNETIAIDKILFIYEGRYSPRIEFDLYLSRGPEEVELLTEDELVLYKLEN